MQFEPPISNPVILKLPAEEIESIYSLTELQESLFSIAFLVSTPQQLAWLNFAEYIAFTETLGELLTRVVAYEEEHWEEIPDSHFMNHDLSRLYIASLDFVAKSMHC